MVGTIVADPANQQSYVISSANIHNIDMWAAVFVLPTEFSSEAGLYSVGRLRDIAFYNNHSAADPAFVVNTVFVAVSESGQVYASNSPGGPGNTQHISI
jgi:hypothetical protein